MLRIIHHFNKYKQEHLYIQVISIQLSYMAWSHNQHLSDYTNEHVHNCVCMYIYSHNKCIMIVHLSLSIMILCYSLFYCNQKFANNGVLVVKYIRYQLSPSFITRDSMDMYNDVSEYSTSLVRNFSTYIIIGFSYYGHIIIADKVITVTLQLLCI